MTPEKAGEAEFIEQLTNLAPDLCVTAAYGCYLPKKFLSLPPLGTLNIHPSLLPLYRGASPVQRSIENGDSKLGVSVLYTVKEMDAGPVLAREEVDSDGVKGAGWWLEELFDRGTKLLVREIPGVLRGEVGFEDAEVQDDGAATKAGMITPEEGGIDVLTTTAREAKDRIRAFDMWPGCYVTVRIEGEEEVRKLKIGEGRVLEGEVWEGGGDVITGKWGVKVKCKGGTVMELVKVQPVGKKMMDGKSWVNGLGGKGVEIV